MGWSSVAPTRQPRPTVLHRPAQRVCQDPTAASAYAVQQTRLSASGGRPCPLSSGDAERGGTRPMAALCQRRGRTSRASGRPLSTGGYLCVVHGAGDQAMGTKSRRRSPGPAVLSRLETRVGIPQIKSGAPANGLTAVAQQPRQRSPSHHGRDHTTTMRTTKLGTKPR